MRSFSYPVLSNRDYVWFRVGGPGLANCLFFATQAYVYAKKNGAEFIEPTWMKFSIGPWIRREKDKRIYRQLFRPVGIRGLKKLLLISPLASIRGKKIVKFSSLGNYFADLSNNVDIVNEYLSKIVLPETVSRVDEQELADVIAIHVRLGDYVPELRIPLDWYCQVTSKILSMNPSQKFALFSDGTNEELEPLLSFQNVKKVFYGNAFADMWAISKCKLVIASDSTFSAWGAFMGQKPIVFSKRHFPSVYNGTVPECVLGLKTDLPEELRKIILDE